MNPAQQERWAATEAMRTLATVELSAVQPVIHITPCCGPDSNKIMVNTYEFRSHFLNPDEARDLARKLTQAAQTVDSALLAYPYLGEWK